MTPFVQLQKLTIDWLFRKLETDEKLLRELLQAFRQPQHEFLLVFTEWSLRLEKQGLRLPLDDDWGRLPVVFRGIILEQINDSGATLKIRNLLGTPLRNYRGTYGLTDWVKNRGDGENCLRTRRFAQVGVLKIGDTLATGEHVTSLPREGGNGSVLVQLSDGPGRREVWFEFPSRIALALLTPEDNPPEGLVQD